MNKYIKIFLMIGVVFCTSAKSQEIIDIKGSDTMFLLAQKWAEQYMKINDSVSIKVSGGGSGIGIDALIDGTADICISSRPMSINERQKLKSRYHSLGVEIVVAKDGLSFYLNKNNPVNELTIEQVRKILKGEITNWKEVGGDDSRIIVCGREPKSGTYSYIRDFIINLSPFTPSMQSYPNTVSIVNAVKKEPGAIGYGGAAFTHGVKCAGVAQNGKSLFFKPSAENVRNNLYPVSRYLYFYTSVRPKGESKKFIDWVLSPEGQKITTENGYFPVK